MITVDKEFESLIPPLSPDEFAQLEENCVKDGIRDPLVVWDSPDGEILVDGHNRWKISANHAGLPFQTVKMHFENRDAVREWIIKNQFGRRNIPPYMRAWLALKLKPIIAEKAEQRMKAGKSDPMLNSTQGSTREGLAKIAKVGQDTIRKVEIVEKSDNEAVKTAARAGDISVNKAYETIKAENAALKRRVHELENREPEVVTETVEVVPDSIRKELETAKYDAERAERDFRKMKKKYEDAQEKVEYLTEKMGASNELVKAERDIQYFTTATNDYIRRYGGHVWAFAEIQNVDEAIKTDYLKAIKALDAFAQQMIMNIEGGIA